MSDIKIREEKIQEKRKKTPWREFVKEICSRYGYNFYKNDGIISRMPHIDRIKIVSYNKFDYDLSIIKTDIRDEDFFKSLAVLLHSTGLPSLFQTNTENCDFADNTGFSKNVYLSMSVVFSENVLYSCIVKGNCNYVLNSLCVYNNCSNIFDSVYVINSSNVFGSSGIINSSYIYESSNCVGCHFCINCVDLENQSYCINNKKTTEDEFRLFYAKYQYSGRRFEESDFVYNSDHITNGHFVDNTNYGNNLLLIGGSGETNEHLYDAFACGSKTSSNIYAGASSGIGDHFYCCFNVAIGSHNLYSIFLENCSYCLGCIGLKNKQFCILNKQYTKEERFELADKIFAQMDKDGTLGQFFPGSMNPFYFNDTAAYLIDDSFTKEEVTKQGYLRRDEEIKVDVPANAEVISTKDLDNYQGFNASGEREIKKDILKKVIKDEQGNYYRIMPLELDFLQKHGLPLPEIHRLERIKLGFKFK